MSGFLAWAAGFVDGEGCIGISRGRASFYLDLTVAQNDPRPLYELQSYFGGAIGNPTRPDRPRSRPTFYWRVRGHAAARALRAMRPYLRVKGEEADLAFAFMLTKGRPHVRASRWAKAEQESYRLALMDAHHRELVVAA